jgi:hypothetical protein
MISRRELQMMRQGANSAVRFTTYTTLKQLVQGTARPGQTLPSAITFGIGSIAGLVTVYTTMPLEYVSLFLSCPDDLLIYFDFLRYLVSLKHECSLWKPVHSIEIPSTVLIESSRRKVS